MLSRIEWILGTLLTGVLVATFPAARACAEDWETIHQEMFEETSRLASEFFVGDWIEDPSPSPSVSVATQFSFPSIIVVGFTGGLEKKDSWASGVTALRNNLEARLEDPNAVLPITFNNLRWRRAASQVLDIVRAARQSNDFLAAMQQPLIVAYGHSWGAGAIAKFARALKKEGVEISLAIYIDAFSWRNPRVPDNVRLAVNFYQRAGIFQGLPMRGKSKLIPEDPQATRVLGSYEIKPHGRIGGRRWNVLKLLLYKQHHRIAHDPRLERFLLEIVNRNLLLLNRTLAVAEPASKR